MSKRVGLVLTNEAAASFEKILGDVNYGFKAGKVTPSNLISEIILSTKVDVKALQLKYTDLRRSLRALSQREEIDVETAIEILSEIAGKAQKKRGRGRVEEETPCSQL